ncbi:DUF2497 domain-containing protein [Sphingobium sp. DEHP117]|uniref:DUF2497 domain-containing protein n=1 Tax=Sphingobium sp. DEHP117 TaxID=2993436 RepID=UPI0027D4D84C|nr:DUF2497 domain-containing protein [Sphingobium sp. DEHP117]MDQ4420287.1 DUF2497 domain-containing protein [Sphingobium sp. DEHP117]
MGDMSKEPSMEEILSSIKRIIAEDGEIPPRKEPKSAARRDTDRESRRKAVVASLAKDADDGIAASSYVDEVLELTEEMPRVGQAIKADSPVVLDELVDETLSLDDIALELDSSFDMADEVSAERIDEEVAMETAAPVSSPSAESIVSQASEAATRSSLAALSSLMIKPSEPEAAENTLEGLVREMLRPMMKDWLDANLPRLVEGMVAKEIARITGRPL